MRHLIAAAALLLASCGEQPKPQEATLWEVPPTPGPFRVVVDGQALPEDVVLLFVERVWAEEAVAVQPGEDLEALFLERIAELFGPLVDTALFLREAEKRQGVLAEERVDLWLAELRRATDLMYDHLLETLGEEGLRAHARRQIRLRDLEKDFASTVEVSEAECRSRYDKIVEEMSGDAARLVEPFENWRSAIEESLRTEGGRARAAAWVQRERSAIKASVIAPGGGATSL